MNLGARNKTKLIKMMLSKCCNFTLWHFHLFENRVRSPTFGPKQYLPQVFLLLSLSLSYTDGLPQILKSTNVPQENVQTPPPLTICGLSLCMRKAWRLKNDSHPNSATQPLLQEFLKPLGKSRVGEGRAAYMCDMLRMHSSGCISLHLSLQLQPCR